jgi:transposase
VEAAGHYHQPLLSGAAWPAGWQLVELNPAHVSEQRRVQGRRRVKTDAIDLEAITELVLAGRGVPVTAGRDRVIGELAAWSAHRRRRVQVRTATKNQLLAQLDRCFPGLGLALPDVLGTRVGRLVAEHFADPGRLASLGATRFVRFARTRGLRVDRAVAERLVEAAAEALPTRDAVVARQVLAADLVLLEDLDAQVAAAEVELARLLPDSPFAPLTTVPGWGVVRAAGYGAAVGDPARWPGPRQLYRASGLSPMQYESARKRRDGAISREGSVQLRRALIELGLGLWLNDPRRQPLRRPAAGTRQERRGDRLRPGQPRQPDRVRPGPRPTALRPAPLGTTSPGSSSIAGQPAAVKKRSTWSARSAARTNDVDRAEPRQTMGRRGRPSPPTERRPPTPSQPPVHRCRLEADEGPDQTPRPLWRAASRCYAAPSLAAGPSPSRQLERRQMTRHAAPRCGHPHPATHDGGVGGPGG